MIISKIRTYLMFTTKHTGATTCAAVFLRCQCTLLLTCY